MNWLTQPAFAPPAPAPRVTWDQMTAAMNWGAGEHVTLIGPTGRGKTEALLKLVELRRYVVFLGTKRQDSTQDRLQDDMQYRLVKDADEIHPDVATHYLFRPPFPKDASAGALKRDHGAAFTRVLIRLRKQMGWTIAVDECNYLAHYLGLGDELELLWLQGRSEGTSVIANTQRPRFIPLAAYSQATHLFFWGNPDSNDLNRMAELATFNKAEVVRILQALPHHDVLYVNTVSGQMLTTNTRW